MKTRSGKVLQGTVSEVVSAVSAGQAVVTGSLAATTAVTPEPFLVRVNYGDPEDGDFMEPRSMCTVAIYTESVVLTPITRKAVIRILTILNSLNPAL